MSKHRTHGTIRNRLLSGLLCLALVLGLLPAGSVLPAKAASWADPYGQQLVEWGIMRGDIAGNLNLDRPISRAEFVTMCNRAFGYKKMGTMPFNDVPSYEWYAEDINIAYNAGYFNGTSATTASPMANLTREQAAVLLARNLMLREIHGESLGFSDSRTLSEWSRGLIAAAVEEGMINGYSDGTFRPFNNITRGEVAAMLVRVIGNPINKEGSYTMGDVYGNVMISSSNVTLRDTTIVGNLYITGGVDLGNVLLENVTVLGRIVVSGAGESNASQASVVLRNVEADELVIDSMINQFVTIRAQGVTDIPLTSVRSDAYIDDSSWPGYGLHRIELDAEPGAKLQLAGSIKEVVNYTPSSDLQLVQGTAEKITIDEYARNSQVLIDTGTRVDELNLDVATLVTGNGDIKTLNIGAAGCEVDILPDTVVIRPGITGIIKGEEIGSVEASDLSSQPRLMAGYPTVTNIAPTEAEALLCGNKAGTIYWAISSLADGSVSEDDLIKNPVYGGNIFEKQAGSINASAKTEYGRPITKLVPDGSYYISAIMVDGRGRRSPLKVAAFTTPDNTVPAFVGQPQLTKNTTLVAQVTATANKNCLLYWALLPAGSAAPTPQEFKTGSLGGNFGYGSLSMVKNVPTSITVNRSRLQEKTTYELYLWLTDHNGAQSMATPVRITFTTPDETPPIVTGIEQIAPYSANGARVTFAMNEAPATLYWAVVAEGDESFIAQGKDAEATMAIMRDKATKIKVESGRSAGAITSGATPVAGAYTETIFNITNLITATTNTNNYTLFYVGKDADGNYSEEVKSIPIRTLDTWAPTVKYEFTAINGSNEMEPLPDSGIKLVFSEQVKGGRNADRTFLELYQDVANAVEGTPGWDSARETLEKALSEHILLYYVPMDGRQPILLNTASTAQQEGGGKVDFKNAIVRMEGTNLVVFLPGDADKGKDSVANSNDAVAVQLKSGATYYVQLQGVFDNAINPNGVAANRDTQNTTGNFKMENFTTVYAQIILNEEPNCTSIPTNETNQTDYKNLRLDMCFEVKPTSTSKVPDTERWALIMQTDTTVYVQVYRQEYDENGNLLNLSKQVANKAGDDTWELLNNTPAVLEAKGGQEFTAWSLEVHVLGKNSFGVLNEDLKEGHTYRYGLHFTQLIREPEGSDKTIDPPTWSGTVRMKFSVIAGSSSGVRTVATYTENYNPNSTNGMNGTGVSVISQISTTTGQEKELTIRRPYRDIRVPEFQANSPTFTVDSGSITMRLALNREGTIRYVVARAENGIATTVGTGSSQRTINPKNDGSEFDSKFDLSNNMDWALKRNELDGNENYKETLTYIPMNGDDRVCCQKYIAFTSYEAQGGEAAKSATKYSAPFYGDIVNPPASWSRNGNIYIGAPVVYDGTMPPIVVNDPDFMKPETEYYIYFVLESVSGKTSEIVEIYRVTTPKAKAPVVTISGSSTKATMTTPNNSGTVMYYALATLPTLPKTFTDKYHWSADGKTGGQDYTVLEAMMRRSGEYTYFDLYAEVVKPGLKDEVRRYISESGYTLMGEAPVQRYPAANGPVKDQDFANDMKSQSVEYVVFVAAKNRSAGDEAEAYGFAAARNLYYPDPEPPEFITGAEYGGSGGDRLLQITPTSVTIAGGDGTNLVDTDWAKETDKLGSYRFGGSLTISFDKPLYVRVYDSTAGTIVNKEVWATSKANVDTAIEAAKLKGDTLYAVSIEEIMTKTSSGTWTLASDARGTAAQSFTFNYANVRHGDGFELPNLGNISNSNSASTVSNKRLRVALDTTVTTKHYSARPDEVVLTLNQPSWRMTWK